MSDLNSFNLTCPAPIGAPREITLAHGGGGAVMHRLINEVFLAAFENSLDHAGHDAAVFTPPAGRLAFTTDSYVVQPLRFPGGDIGSMAVHGTVNDLAMAGARPCFLSAGFILEEGLPIDTLRTIVASMAAAARESGVQIVTGDTKVIDYRNGDGLYINTAGVGAVAHERVIAPAMVKPGDCILVNGDLGRHGIAIMAQREGMTFETTIESDSAPVAPAVLALLEAGIEVHCLRDLTRGGLASTANEIASAAGLSLELRERDIPVRDDVRGACELFGFDPLYVANEGRFAAFLPESQGDAALEVLASHAKDTAPARIGRVTDAAPPRVLIENQIGVMRILDMLSGEQLPRIC